ncbi:uncharacterized protein LOC144095470 isoform X2 [Amblyomma americanum]
MATWNDADWQNEADIGSAAESVQVAAQNSSLECDIDVSVTLARSSYTTASKRTGPFVDLTSDKSGLSLDEDSILDGDVDKEFPPGDSALIPGLSDVSLPPKHVIAADPLDLSLSDGDDVLAPQAPSTKGLETIREEPELEAQMELEHAKERNPEELSTHMEEEPAPLELDALPLRDQELSTEPGNEVVPDPSEPHLKVSEQSLAEPAAVQPEDTVSDVTVQGRASAAAALIIEDLPVRPKSPYQTRNRPQISAQTPVSPSSPEKLTPPPADSRPPPLSQRNTLGARRKTTAACTEAPRANEVIPPVVAKGYVANQFLEKIGQLRGSAVAAEGGHDTYPLAEDLMSIEGAQKQTDKYKKEEFGELFTKRPSCAAHLIAKSAVEAESEDEDSALDFDHLPIRRRMDIWKKREDRAIRKGLILIPKMCKQGRFAISAAGL